MSFNDDRVNGVQAISDMVAKAVSKMKQCKAPGPSGVVAEMIKAVDEVCIPMLTNLANAIIAEKKIPSSIYTKAKVMHWREETTGDSN